MHPEIDKYGLNGDYNLWTEFNKENLMRKWIQGYRKCWVMFEQPENIPNEGIEVDCGNQEERELAEVALEELIEAGLLNPVTYVKEIA